MKSVVLAALAVIVICPAVAQGSDAFITQVELQPRVSVTVPAVEQVAPGLVLDVPVVPLTAMAGWHDGLVSLLDTADIPSGAEILQQGDGNDALIQQSDPSNHGLIHQSGTANGAILTQMGHLNRAAITQSGSGSRGAILQTGARNRAMIVQLQ